MMHPLESPLGGNDCTPWKSARGSRLHAVEVFHLTGQKNVNFAIRRVQKKVNITIDLLSLDTKAPGPQVWTYRLQILRGV